MTQFYKEITPSGFGIAIKQKEVLFSEQSPFQKVEIFESDSTLGRVLTLDDLMMTTEGDEYHYHEMIAHIPMMHHKAPKTVLVIGGGDGGTVREVLKHDTVEKVVLCEIDGMVIDACKKYLPTIACELDNPKCEILVEDAIEYAKKINAEVYLVNYSFPVKGTKSISEINLEDFLSLIKYAKCVFTGSYHGMLFSIYFEKDFWFYNRAHAERMISLASRFNLLSRDRGKNQLVMESIDYSKITPLVKEFRNESKKWLNNAILKTEERLKNE